MGELRQMESGKCEALRKCIHELVDDISEAALASNFPRVHQVCKILHSQLLRIKQVLINGDLLVDFLFCLQTVARWGEDVRGARLEKWPSVAACIVRVVDAYEENDYSEVTGSFVAALLGDEFLQLYGQQFGREIVSFFSQGRKDHVEGKRQTITSLWRYYEQHRKEFDGVEGSCGKYIGVILNNLSIRHENDKQWTSEFLKTHTEAEYEVLLDNVMLLMINAFARRNLMVKVEPFVKAMLKI